jgi:arylsulfatase A-like enzyme
MTCRYPIALASAFALLLTGTLSGPARAQANHNILMIIADDVGVDMIGEYQQLEGSQQVPPTPTIDSLAQGGILFENAWSNPACATTRATIQTGRYSYRTGILSGGGTLAAEESSIAEILSRDPALDYTHATFGKWGLAHRSSSTHPVETGYDFFAGRTDYSISDYFNWEKHTARFDVASSCEPSDPAWHGDLACVLASTRTVTRYATTINVNDTLNWIGSLPSGQPWFVILSFNAGHFPYHVPPLGLHSYDNGTLSCPGNDDATCYRAMIEAMDTAIQRLLGYLPLGHTTIIFVGDNGSPPDMAVPPFDPDRAKHTLYEGGINVPLIIAGADVLGPARISDALVNTTDLFMTVLELAGVDPSVLPTNLPDIPGDSRYNGQAWEHDSFSLAPILRDDCNGGCSVKGIRHYAYAERKLGNGATIRNRAGYKLARNPELGVEEPWKFFFLSDDPFEDDNLVDPVTGALLNGDPKVQVILDDLKQKLGAPGEAPDLPPVNLDPDADGVADDGDGSGVSGDAPCTGGQTVNCDDNCPIVPNTDQGNADGDGLGDACDNCLLRINDNQYDADSDGYGNMCDADYDDDHWVGLSDLLIFRQAWLCVEGEDPCYDDEVDVLPNGTVGAHEYSLFRQQWMGPPGPSGLSCAGTTPCPD